MLDEDVLEKLSQNIEVKTDDERIKEVSFHLSFLCSNCLFREYKCFQFSRNFYEMYFKIFYAGYCIKSLAYCTFSKVIAYLV